MDPHIKHTEADRVAELYRAITAVRQTNPRMEAGYIAYFLYVALHPECRAIDVQEALKLSSSSANRIRDYLSSPPTERLLGTEQRPIGVLDAWRDPRNNNHIRLRLSARGRMLLSGML